jgi:hypothetical protein
VRGYLITPLAQNYPTTLPYYPRPGEQRHDNPEKTSQFMMPYPVPEDREHDHEHDREHYGEVDAHSFPFERLTGFEPARTAWEAAMLPLHHSRRETPPEDVPAQPGGVPLGHQWNPC